MEWMETSMTTIQTGSSAAIMSPRQRMDSRLAAEIQAGSIKPDDKDALSSALDDIDAQLAADRPPQGSRPDPQAMKKKIDGLIDGEVTAGTLTSEQAAELKQLFARGPGGDGQGKGGPGGLGGPGGPGGPGGAAGPGGVDSDSDDDSSDLLTSFLETLRERLTTGGTYGQDGSTSAQAKFAALLIDRQA
jgi:hypothetical protein